MFCWRTTTRMLLAGMFAIMDGGNNINKVKHTDNETSWDEVGELRGSDE